MGATAARRSRSTRAGPAAKQPLASIDNFARVSKRVASTGKLAIGKDAAERILAEKVRQTAIEIVLPAAPPAPTVAAVPAAPTSKKRKAATAVDNTEKTTSQSTPTTPRSAKRVRSSKQEKKTSPKGESKRQPTLDADGDVELSDEEQTGALLERLNLHSTDSPYTTRCSSPLTANTAITTPCESDAEYDAATLPQDLVDLLNLHSCFLKALGLHVAHHGTNVPVDVCALCPSVAQAWGKRRVTLDDIRRCLGVLEMRQGGGVVFDTARITAKPLPFFLSDYGRGKVCIELAAAVAAGPRPLDDEKLHAAFEKNLRDGWAKWRRGSPSSSPSDTVAQFVAALPKAAIKQCESLMKASPLLNKGQRTLEELRQGIALKKQQEKEAEEARARAAPGLLNADGSKMSLLDRIRYRQQQLQLQQAEGGGSSAPSAADLARRAALQRAGDVAAVIAMLGTASGGGAQKRMSFTMAAVLKRLRESLRLPVSKEEGAACVRLLAAEVAPQWMQIVTVGGRENVILLADFTPSKAAIEERVRALSA